MKFWLTLTVGIVLVTALATGFYVGMPKSRPGPRSWTAPAAPSGDHPKAAFDATEKRLENVGRKEGHTDFEIRNEGPVPLELGRGKLNCDCAGARLHKPGMGPDENERYLRLAPGEVGTYTIDWNTTKRTGDVRIEAELITNDPTQRSIYFRLLLEVRPDVAVEPTVIVFGEVGVGQTGVEGTVEIFSTTRDDLAVTNPTTTSKAFSVRLEPMDAAALAERKAKSGVRAIVRIDGVLPAGPLDHLFTFSTNSPHEPQGMVALTGTVMGQFEAVPSRIQFPAGTPDKEHRQNVSVFARSLPAGQTLVVGQVLPPFLQASLEQDPRSPVLWKLAVVVPKGAPNGPFAGMITIRDEAGTDKLVVLVQGIVAGSGLSGARNN